jgi:mannose-6-phosphate isomerase-like protein (cupin superfamily)
MLTTLIEVIADRYLAEEIKDAAIGELWELDRQAKDNGVSAISRAFKNLWNLGLLIKASVDIDRYLEDQEFPNASVIESEKSISYAEQDIGLLPSDRRRKEVSDYSFTSVGFKPGELRVIKQYCDLRVLASPKDSREFIKSTTQHVERWLQQTDRIILRSRHRGQSISCGSIVNSFILSEFVRRIESFPPDTVSPSQFRELVNGLNLPVSFLDRYAEFRTWDYVRKLVCKTWSLVVYVISWEPGQEVLMHHHGGALDAIKVIRGTMTHWQLSPEEKSSLFPFESFDKTVRYEGRSETLKAGEVAVVDRLHAHQIANLSDERLLTLHIRLGPSPEDGHWRTTADTEMLVWNQIEGCFDLFSPDSFNPLNPV